MASGSRRSIKDQQKGETFMASGSRRSERLYRHCPEDPDLDALCESAIDRRAMILSPIEIARSGLPPNPRPQDNWSYAPWVPNPGEPVPFPNRDYFPHVASGAKVLSVPRRSPFSTDLRYPENKGHLAVAVTLQDGVLFAINHCRGSTDTNKLVVSLAPNIIATIAGGEFPDCLSLLHGLQMMCNDYKQTYGWEISLGVALEFLTITLSSRPEVGLIAGWDYTMGCPAVYRVDGYQGLMRGEIMATGSGFRELYAQLDLNAMFMLKGYSHLESRLKGILHKPPRYRNYCSWSLWSVDEAVKVVFENVCSVIARAEEYGDLISMSFVGHHGLTHIHCDEPVEHVGRTHGIVVPERISTTFEDPAKRPTHIAHVPLPPIPEEHLTPRVKRIVHFERYGVMLPECSCMIAMGKKP